MDKNKNKFMIIFNGNNNHDILKKFTTKQNKKTKKNQKKFQSLAQ